MIYIPKICGTCAGSAKAINLAYELYEKESKKDNPKKIVVYKEILHNNYIINDLKKKGIECVEDLDDVDSNNIVIIRAHGEPKKTYEYLDKKHIEYYDATCVNVLRIHKIISEKYYQNYEIIIIGKRTGENSYHPEVEGSNGWCQNNAHIIDNIDEVDSLNFKKDKCLIICQTTIGEKNANEIAEKIQKKFPNKQIEYVNSICHAQKLIQKSSVEVAKKCDYMIVIGGKKSSNTNELYKMCNEVCNSVKISSLKELYDWLKKVKITQNTNIGITGGASTPNKEIEEYKQLLEFYLFYKNEKIIFEKNINKYNKKFLDNSDNEIVKDAIKRFLNINKDGKYLRATLISLGYKLASNNTNSKYLPLALAYETFQTSILIHDDIIDSAVIRRGKDTIPVTYMNDFKNKTEDSTNVANSLGLCIGDLGFYFANQIILNNYSKDNNISDILKYYNDIVIKTIKGEIIDVKLPYDIKYEKTASSNEEDVFEIYCLKTAWYTIIGPFCLGLLLGGVSINKIKKYEKILLNVGIAFQIKDDLIGVFGDEKYIGKSTNSDISEFKQTILYSYVASKNDKYLKELDKYYGKKDLTKNDIEKVKEIFIESNAVEYANKIMNDLFFNSYEQIKELKINNQYKNILLGFINYLEIREK